MHCGYHVIEARNGAAGIKAARDETPDIILLDVDMPVMNGWEALKLLGENPVTRAIPVVMLTSFPLVQGEAAALSAGASHYIPKPWIVEIVKLTVRVALRDAERELEEKSPGGRGNR